MGPLNRLGAAFDILGTLLDRQLSTHGPVNVENRNTSVLQPLIRILLIKLKVSACGQPSSSPGAIGLFGARSGRVSLGRTGELIVGGTGFKSKKNFNHLFFFQDVVVRLVPSSASPWVSQLEQSSIALTIQVRSFESNHVILVALYFLLRFKRRI